MPTAACLPCVRAEFLQARLEDERRLFPSNGNPGCGVEEVDSPIGPENRIPRGVAAAPD